MHWDDKTRRMHYCTHKYHFAVKGNVSTIFSVLRFKLVDFSRFIGFFIKRIIQRRLYQSDVFNAFQNVFVCFMYKFC